MTTASKNFSNELLNAYKNHQFVMLQTTTGHVTGTVAAVKDGRAYIDQPAKGVLAVNLSDVTQVQELN